MPDPIVVPPDLFSAEKGPNWSDKDKDGDETDRDAKLAQQSGVDFANKLEKNMKRVNFIA